jgi:hypothetical protein
VRVSAFVLARSLSFGILFLATKEKINTRGGKGCRCILSIKEEKGGKNFGDVKTLLILDGPE